MNMIDDVLYEARESSLTDMTQQDSFLLNLDEIDLSLLRLSSSPDSHREFPRHSPISNAAASSAAAVSVAGDNSPMKRTSPDFNVSDQPKRRKIFVQNQDLISPPIFSRYPGNPSPSDPTRNPARTGDRTRLAPFLHRRSLFDACSSPASEKQETTPLRSKSFFEKTTSEESTESQMLMIMNNRVKEMNQCCNELVRHGEEHCHKEHEDTSKETRELDSEEDSEEGMRIERSGDGYVIRLKCRCRQAYRILFSDSHFYFKLL